MQTDIVFVSQVFHPDAQSTGVLLSMLAKAIVRHGIRCEVLAGYPASEELCKTCRRKELWFDVEVRRGGLRWNAKRSLVARGCVYITFCAWLTWRLMFCVPPHARVVVVTNPPFAPIIVWLCAQLRRYNYSVILHDIYPDSLVGLCFLSENAVIVRLWRALNRKALTGSTSVVVLGRDMKTLCKERYGVLDSRIVIIPPWSPVEFRVQVAPQETVLWRRLGLSDCFVVQYSGNMGLWHDLETVVRAASLLRSHQEIRFLLIGNGCRRARAEELARNLQITNITWLPLQPSDEISDSLSCCHAALVSQRPGVDGTAVPSKLYGILASGRPVLLQATPFSEAARVVTEERCGIVTPPGDPSALAEAILKLAGDMCQASAMGDAARGAYSSKYTFERAFDAFTKAIVPAAGT